MDDFSPRQLFFTRALLYEHLEQAIVAAYKPWASTSLKGVLGGLKSDVLFLLIVDGPITGWELEVGWGAY